MRKQNLRKANWLIQVSRVHTPYSSSYLLQRVTVILLRFLYQASIRPELKHMLSILCKLKLLGSTRCSDKMTLEMASYQSQMTFIYEDLRMLKCCLIKDLNNMNKMHIQYKSYKRHILITTQLPVQFYIQKDLDFFPCFLFQFVHMFCLY